MIVSKIYTKRFYNFKGLDKKPEARLPINRSDSLDISPKAKYLAKANKFKSSSYEIIKNGKEIQTKAQEQLEIAKDIQAESTSVLEKAKELNLSVQELLNYAENSNFEDKINRETKDIEAEFFINSSGNLVINDYRDPKKRRTIIISEDKISVLEGAHNSEFYSLDRQNGELLEFFNGLDNSDKKTLRAKKHFAFENETLKSVDLNYEKDSQGREKSIKHIEYNDGKTSSINMHWQSNKKDNSQSAKEEYSFDGDVLKSLSCKTENNEQIKKVSSTYRFRADGSLSIYAKNLEVSDKKTKTDYLFQFDENNFTVWHNRKHFSDNITLSDELYSFKDNNPESCIINYRQAKSYPVAYDSKIDF